MEPPWATTGVKVPWSLSVNVVHNRRVIFKQLPFFEMFTNCTLFN